MIVVTCVCVLPCTIHNADTSVSCSVSCRIDLAKPDQPNQVELGRKDESKVHRLFLDPTGEKTIMLIQSLDSLF